MPLAPRAAPYPTSSAQATNNPAIAGHGRTGVKTMSVTALALAGMAYSPSRSRIAGTCT